MTTPSADTAAGTCAGATILAIFAHPDDESIACGGTLARLADAGARVVLLCATRGERGGHAGPVRDDELGLLRVREMRDAAEALGIREVILLDHPDGELRWREVPEFHAEIVSLVRRYSPACVISFGADGLYWHVDHIGTYERTLTALQALGASAPPFYGVTMPRGIMRPVVESARTRGWAPPTKGFWSLEPDAFGLHANPPTVVVDVRPWVGRKLSAILCHRTQMGSGHPFDQMPQADAERWLGTEHFHRITTGSDTKPVSLLDSLGARQTPAATRT